MRTPNKRVAILSPIAWRTPPQQYGAWETVASNVTEGLVARGWDVTLFASGDSVTCAHLHAVLDRGYEEDSTLDPKVAEYLHISEAFEHAAEFDLIHSHYDFMPLSYTRLVKTPVLTTIHGFSSAKIMPIYQKYRDGYFVSVSDSDRATGLNTWRPYTTVSIFPCTPFRNAVGMTLFSLVGSTQIKVFIWPSRSLV
jgi:glycosyl transferase family 4